MVTNWQERLNLYSKYSALALGFSIPLSTALMSIFSVLTVLLVIISGQWHKKLRLIKSNPLAIVILLLFVLLIIGSFYSIAPLNSIGKEVKKYSTLLLFIFLLPIFQQKKWRQLGIITFVAAMLIQLVGGSIIHLFIDSSRAVLVHDHISIGILMAFTCFIYLHLAFNTTDKRKRYLLLALFTLTIIYMLWIDTGRTAYICFFVLLLVSFIQLWRWKGTICAIIVILLLGATTYYLSPTLHRQASHAINNTMNYQTNEELSDANAVNNSAGLRLRWAQYSLRIIKAYPVFGAGTGAFETATKKIAYPNEQLFLTDKPHNDILTITAQLGLIGLLLLLLLYISHGYISVKLEIPEKYLAQLLLVAMIVGGLFNSLLRDGIPSHFYVYMSALLLSHYQPKQ